MEKKKSEIEFSKRNTAFAPLKSFSPLSRAEDYIEVTQWTNWEGYDVNILDASGTRSFSLTDQEFTAIKKLIKHIDKEIEKEWKLKNS